MHPFAKANVFWAFGGHKSLKVNVFYFIQVMRNIMSKSKKVVKIQERPRNLLTLAPIMQKGGAHGKTPKALRRAEHQHIQKSAREGFASREDAPVRLLAA